MFCIFYWIWISPVGDQRSIRGLEVGVGLGFGGPGCGGSGCLGFCSGTAVPDFASSSHVGCEPLGMCSSSVQEVELDAAGTFSTSSSGLNPLPRHISALFGSFHKSGPEHGPQRA